MADTYICKDGDMVDALCWRYYPKKQQALAVERVYEANPKLADFGLKLSAGTKVFLPDLPTPRTTPIIGLWGRS